MNGTTSVPKSFSAFQYRSIPCNAFIACLIFCSDIALFGGNEREKLRRSVRYHGHIQVYTGRYVCFELKDNLFDSTVLNTGETGDIYF